MGRGHRKYSLSVASFWAPYNSCKFSRAQRWLQSFLRLTLILSFPALNAGCNIWFAYHWLQVFPRLQLSSASFFPVNGRFWGEFSCSNSNFPRQEMTIFYLYHEHLLKSDFTNLVYIKVLAVPFTNTRAKCVRSYQKLSLEVLTSEAIFRRKKRLFSKNLRGTLFYSAPI